MYIYRAPTSVFRALQPLFDATDLDPRKMMDFLYLPVTGSYLSRSTHTHTYTHTHMRTYTGGIYIFDVLNGLCGIIAIIITIILNTKYANFDNNLYC